MPTIPTVTTGARALMVNARAEAVDENSATVSMWKKNFPASGSKPEASIGMISNIATYVKTLYHAFHQ